MSAAAQRRHVHEVDVVRVLTFAFVIMVHTVSHTNSVDSVSAQGVEMLLHFTRESFFVLTGLVLSIQYLDRPIVLRDFYRRRVPTVLVPYLAWTVIYSAIDRRPWTDLAREALFGTAQYHLYFLLVSIQIYLLFPLLAVVVRRTRGQHGLVLGLMFTAQAALYGTYQYGPTQSSGLLGDLSAHRDVYIVSYAFYVLAGAIAADHLGQLRAFIDRRWRWALPAAVMTACAAVLVYLADVHGGSAPNAANGVLQPVMLLWSPAMIGVLFCLGRWWDRTRTAGSKLDRILTVGSDRSFGIFLVHPAIISLVLLGAWTDILPALSRSLLVYVLVVIGSVLAVEVLRRTPLSWPLTGRSALRKERHHASDSRPTASSGQAAYQRVDHGDGWRAADPALR